MSARKLGVLGSDLLFNRDIKIYNHIGYNVYISGRLETDDPDCPVRVVDVIHLRIFVLIVYVSVKQS